MDKSTFEQFRTLIRSSCGISLSDEKIPLLMNRINKRLRALNLKDPKEYLNLVISDNEGNELVQLIDVVSTNVTHFYREAEHFTILADVLKEADSKKNLHKLRIWCAACSSGEEAYTLAITAKESLNLDSRHLDLKILATDISTRMLRSAAEGTYAQKQLDNMPAQIKQRYFSRVQGAQDSFLVDPNLKKFLSFRRLNLAETPYPLTGPLDIIFCRNVMIYFDRDLRQKISTEFSRLLRPGGLLFVSRSENLLGIKHDYKNFATAVYQKPE